MSVVIKVSSYNIRKCVGLDWKRNPNRIVDIIAELDTDIVILQEADKRLGDRPGTLPIKRFAELGYSLAPLSANDTSHGWHGNAIFYRDSLTIIRCQNIVIPQREPRGAVSASFKHPDGYKFECIGVHLGLDHKVRQKQLLALRHYIEQRDEPYPVIMAGDFNEWRSTKKLQQSFNSDYSIHSPGPSFHTALPLLSLDYFILWGDIEAQSTGYVHQSKLSRKASDHLPIILDVNLKKS